MSASSWFDLKIISIAGLSFFSSSCMSAKHVKAQEIQTDLALRQMHSEIEEQKYKLNRLEVELQIVEGKADSQTKVTQEILKEVAKLSQEESKLLDTTLSELKEKVVEFEERENQLSQSINELTLLTESHSHSLKMHREQFNETDALISEQRQSLKEIQGHLKSLLLACDQEELGHVFYVVRKGDTLVSIATEQGISVDFLIKMNELGSHQLVVGQKLRLK